MLSKTPRNSVSTHNAVLIVSDQVRNRDLYSTCDKLEIIYQNNYGEYLSVL